MLLEVFEIMSINKDENMLLMAINLQSKMIVEKVETFRINKIKKSSYNLFNINIYKSKLVFDEYLQKNKKKNVLEYSYRFSTRNELVLILSIIYKYYCEEPVSVRSSKYSNYMSLDKYIKLQCNKINNNSSNLDS